MKSKKLLACLLGLSLAVQGCPVFAVAEDSGNVSPTAVTTQIPVTVTALDKSTDTEVPVPGATVDLRIGHAVYQSVVTDENGKAVLSTEGMLPSQIQHANVVAHKVMSTKNAISGTGRDALFSNFPTDDAGNYIRATYELRSEWIDENGNWVGSPVKQAPTSQADVVFAIDATGSMDSTIDIVKDNIEAMSASLLSEGYDVRFSVIEFGDMSSEYKEQYDKYRDYIIEEYKNYPEKFRERSDAYESYYGHKPTLEDLVEDGSNYKPTRILSLNGNVWQESALSIKQLLSTVVAEGGGDPEESALDAMGRVASEGIHWRSDASKFVYLMTDDGYKQENHYGYQDMTHVAAALREKGIVASPCVFLDKAGVYQSLEMTGGKIFNLYHPDLQDELSLIKKDIQAHVVNEKKLVLSEARIHYNMSVSYMNDTAHPDYDYYLKSVLKTYKNRLAETTDGHVLIDKFLLYPANGYDDFWDNTNPVSMADIQIQSSPYNFGVTLHSNAHVGGFYTDKLIDANADLEKFATDIYKEANGRKKYERIQMSGVEGEGYDTSFVTHLRDNYYKGTNEYYARTLTHESGHYLFSFFDEYLDGTNFSGDDDLGLPPNYFTVFDGLSAVMRQQKDDYELSRFSTDYSYLGGDRFNPDVTFNTAQMYIWHKSCEEMLSSELTGGFASVRQGSAYDGCVPDFDVFDCPYAASYTTVGTDHDRMASYPIEGSMTDDDFIYQVSKPGGAPIEPQPLPPRSMGSADNAVDASYFDNIAKSDAPISGLTFSAAGDSLHLEISSDVKNEYSVYFRKLGETSYTRADDSTSVSTRKDDDTVDNLNQLYSTDLSVHAEDMAEIRIVCRNGDAVSYHTYFADRSMPTGTGYSYRAYDNTVAAAAFGSDDTEAVYTFVGDMNRYLHDGFVSVNEATWITNDQNNVNHGRIYSVASVNDAIDFSSLSWFRYENGTWKKLDTKVSQEENLNLGASASVDGSGLYVLMAKPAAEGEALPVTELAYTQSETRDAVVKLTFSDPNENSRYYRVLYSEEPITDLSADNIFMNLYSADEKELSLDLTERDKHAYVAIQAVLDDGRVSPVIPMKTDEDEEEEEAENVDAIEGTDENTEEEEEIEPNVIEVVSGQVDSDQDGVPDWYCDLYELWPQIGGTLADYLRAKEYASDVQNCVGYVAPYEWDKAYEIIAYGRELTIAERDPDGDGLTNLEEYQLGSDPIDGNSPVVTENVAVTGVVLPDTADVFLGETTDLTAALLPENASNQTIIWKTDSDDVISVKEDGLVCHVTGLSEGSAVLTAISDDGEFITICRVRVTKKPIAAAESANPVKPAETDPVSNVVSDPEEQEPPVNDTPSDDVAVVETSATTTKPRNQGASAVVSSTQASAQTQATSQRKSNTTYTSAGAAVSSSGGSRPGAAGASANASSGTSGTNAPGTGDKGVLPLLAGMASSLAAVFVFRKKKS